MLQILQLQTCASRLPEVGVIAACGRIIGDKASENREDFIGLSVPERAHENRTKPGIIRDSGGLEIDRGARPLPDRAP